MHNTARRGISLPSLDRSDRPDIPLHFDNLGQAVDVDVLYNQGTNAARLAAAHQTGGGRIWWETDTGLPWWDDGAAWHSYGINPDGLFAFTGATSKLSFSAENAAANTILASRVAADAQDRFVLGADGKLNWGTGGGAVDTNLYRSGIGILKTDGKINAVTGYQVNGVALASTHLSDSAALARLAGPTFTGILRAPDIYAVDTIANVPGFQVQATDAAVDYKNWRNYANGTKLLFTTLSDDGSAQNSWLEVTRTGTTISKIDFAITAAAFGSSIVRVNGRAIQTGAKATARIKGIDGTLYEGTNIASVVHTGVGIYTINFTAALFTAIPNCQVTISNTGSPPTKGFCTFIPATTNVIVHIFDTTGTHVDGTDFHLLAQDNI